MQIPECVVGRDVGKSRFVVLKRPLQPFKSMVIVTSPGEHARNLEGRFLCVFLDQFCQKPIGLVLLPQLVMSKRQAREAIRLDRFLLNRLHRCLSLTICK